MAAPGLAGLNKAPSLDWTADNGLLPRFKVWKRKLELIFKRPLDGVDEDKKVPFCTVV